MLESLSYCVLYIIYIKYIEAGSLAHTKEQWLCVSKYQNQYMPDASCEA